MIFCISQFYIIPLSIIPNGIIPISIIPYGLNQRQSLKDKTMKYSPFKYGFTVSGNSFTNRESEKEKLHNNLISGINTTIISPRRWGKSSLVEAVITDIKRKDLNHKTVLIDLFYVSSEEEFLEAFAEKIINESINLSPDKPFIVKNTALFNSSIILYFNYIITNFACSIN